MKWFHFTDYVGYIKILSKGKLLNYYSILEEDIAGLENINLIKSIHEKNDEKEFKRKSFVYLTPEPHPGEASGKDIRLTFKVDKDPNRGRFLILPELSLDYLTEIAAKEFLIPSIKHRRDISHEGKYSKIPIIQF